MNKREADKQAYDNNRSIGDLKRLLVGKRGSGKMSVINKSLTKDQALDIFEKAWQDRPDDEIPKGHVYNVYKRHDMMSKDGLIIRNILREFAP